MTQIVQASSLGTPNAGVLLSQNVVIVGGTSILEEFFQIVAMQAEGDLAICTPFIDEAFAVASSTWAGMRHAQINVRLVANRRSEARNAWSALRLFPWRSVAIWQCRSLHAKIYSFISPEGGVALVGSHNLTRHGLGVNIEAGILLKALAPGSEFTGAVFTCQEHVNRLVQHSRIFVDTKSWPRPGELDPQEDTRE
jgi:hypothetical protein